MIAQSNSGRQTFLNSYSLLSHLWYLKMCSVVYSVTLSAFFIITQKCSAILMNTEGPAGQNCRQIERSGLSPARQDTPPCRIGSSPALQVKRYH